MMEQLTFIHRVLALIDGETESLTSIMPDNSLNAINIPSMPMMTTARAATRQ